MNDDGMFAAHPFTSFAVDAAEISYTRRDQRDRLGSIIWISENDIRWIVSVKQRAVTDPDSAECRESCELTRMD